VSKRRLYHDQPASFALNAESYARVMREIAKYPEGRQASAVIALLWIGQEQEGWVTKPMVEVVAEMLAMPPIRVLEVASFYTMFRLAPAGKHVVQVCTCVPCCLMGSDEIVKVCKKHIAEQPHTVSADGQLSWEESECLGACVNAPMMQVDADTFEDLTAEDAMRIIEAMRRGETPKPGPQSGRTSSEPHKDKV
jgi:NADH-quinone oxidoreductase subunit E